MSMEDSNAIDVLMDAIGELDDFDLAQVACEIWALLPEDDISRRCLAKAMKQWAEDR